MADAWPRIFCCTTSFSSTPFAIVSPSFRTAPSVPNAWVSRGLYDGQMVLPWLLEQPCWSRGGRDATPRRNSIISPWPEMAKRNLTLLLYITQNLVVSLKFTFFLTFIVI